MPEFVGQVRLVVITAFAGQGCQTGCRIVLKRIERFMEPDDPHKLLWSCAYVLAENPLELFFAQAHRFRQTGHGKFAGRPVDGIDRGGHSLIIVLFKRVEKSREEGFDEPCRAYRKGFCRFNIMPEGIPMQQ